MLTNSRVQVLEDTLRGAVVLLNNIVSSDMFQPITSFDFELVDVIKRDIKGIEEVLKIVPNGKARDIEGVKWSDSKNNVRTVKENA